MLGSGPPPKALLDSGQLGREGALMCSLELFTISYAICSPVMLVVFGAQVTYCGKCSIF
jgi:hypothetical protein